MELLEDDYLGGSGSRGSGQIAFENLKLIFKSRECYEKVDCEPVNVAENHAVKALRQSDYVEKVLKAINGE
jgi:CRISPR-associated protein Csm3